MLYDHFFLNQQFITQHAVVDRGSYFVTTYNKSKLHEEMETEKREREKRYKELIKEIEKKEKKKWGNKRILERIRSCTRINLGQQMKHCQ